MSTSDHPRRPRLPPSNARARASAPCCFARAAGCRFRFFSLALLVPAHPTSSNWILGFALIVPGELIRLAGVAAAGTVTRRRSRDVQRLVTYGIFRWVRNPLYVGNFLIWMGFVIISGVPWLRPAGDRRLRARVLLHRRVRGGGAGVDLRARVPGVQAHDAAVGSLFAAASSASRGRTIGGRR